MQQFSNGDMTFDLDDTGPVDGPIDGETVVLLHGFPENRTSWHAITPTLTAAGYRVLAPDQRGYSPGARPRQRRAYRLELLVGDIVALADAADAERVHVVGHDWGGAVAWGFAALHPERTRTMTSLCTPHPHTMVASMLRSTQLLKSWYMLVNQLPYLPEMTLRPTGAAARAARRKLRATGLPDDAIERYLSPLANPEAARGAVNWYRGLPFSKPLQGKIGVPAMYVYPTRDAFLGRAAADLTSKYAGDRYRYEVIEGGSHWLPEEAPDRIAALLLERFATS